MINLIHFKPKVKLNPIVIFCILNIDGWYINVSSIDDGCYQPYKLSHIPDFGGYISHIPVIFILGGKRRAEDNLDEKITIGSALTVNGRLVTWSPCKQPVNALSTMESELLQNLK